METDTGPREWPGTARFLRPPGIRSGRPGWLGDQDSNLDSRSDLFSVRWPRGGFGDGAGEVARVPSKLPLITFNYRRQSRAREQTPLLRPGARHVEALRDPAAARQRPIDRRLDDCGAE